MMAAANYFALGLTLATLMTGIFWVLIRIKGIPVVSTTEAPDDQSTKTNHENSHRAHRLPAWVIGLGELFPMFLLVLVVRSFFYEAYQIPSGSMMPTLLVGDFILVKKFAYGIREPIFQKQLMATGLPRRGDVVVFKYPEDPSIYFIKRVVGIPGDRVIYRGKRLLIQPAQGISTHDTATVAIHYYPSVTASPLAAELEKQQLTTLTEQLNERSYQILLGQQPNDRAFYYRQPGEPLSEWIVPPGHYFVMGDNRDNSRDSRFWGLVPEDHLVGQAVAIWMSFEKRPDRWPTGIRWQRLGTIR
ncbi:MAG: signal peptidase I [Candidatus Symbiodolus clandestinus]